MLELRWNRRGPDALPLVLIGLLAVPAASCKPRAEAPSDEERAAVELGTRPATESTAAAESTPLGPEAVVERRLGSGEAHRYVLELEPATFFELTVDQRGVDVVVTLAGPGGEPLARADRPINRLGAEVLLGLAERAGTYTVEVAAQGEPDEPAGYELAVRELRPATPTDRRRWEAVGLFLAGDAERRAGDAAQRAGDDQAAAESFTAASASYEAALESWRETGDRFWQAETLDRLAFVAGRRERWAEAVLHAEASTGLFREIGDRRSLAIALTRLGRSRYGAKEWERATVAYREALELRREQGDRQGTGRVLLYLGQTHQALDDLEEALRYHHEALELLEGAGWHAHVYHNLGVLHRSVGQSESALGYLDRAEELYEDLGATRFQAATIHQRGRTLLELGRPAAAVSQLERALELQRGREGEAVALVSLGDAHLDSGDAVRAEARYREALEISAADGNALGSGRALLGLGSLYDGQGRPREAREAFEAALSTYRELGRSTGEAASLLGLARARRRLGDPAAAIERAGEALEVVESIRPRAFSEDVSYAYFATVQHYFEFYVDTLMELDRLEPGVGHAAAALAGAERARARSLLDLMREAAVDLRATSDSALLARERELQQRLNASARRRQQVLAEPESGEAERQAAARELDELFEALRLVRAEIRLSSPHYASLTQPETLGLAEIRGRVLDADTLLLEYMLGAERSFLWAVDREGMRTVELPGRVALEERALWAYDLLKRSHRPESRRAAGSALCEISRVLLEPIAGELGDRRLVVVADGALQYLPFGALADPRRLAECPDAAPLLERNAVSYLPSASVLPVLREQVAGRAAPQGVVAVVADPVFSRGDSRLADGGAGSRPAGAASGPRTADTELPIPLDRLPHSRDEALAILALAPAERSLRALGFSASKQIVLDGRLAGYRIVHLATHGILNATRPGLSGVVFSMLDSEGRPQDGFLRAHELYALDLKADLVVLSACETALGRQVRGEGLVGLTRGFMHAGARRVVVTLWNVGDRSTARLMERFYRAMLVDGSAPADALRSAQLWMWRQRAAPYYWGGFMLQGEYR